MNVIKFVHKDIYEYFKLPINLLESNALHAEQYTFYF